ncbi:unnamed protein product [Thlaspi arvense]|uniref:PB1 domain-containing protein n=1 Tax=Thlaspi arvense TaxID=13288 RepID=A0AAU9SYH7_THLAR|nr:unnamed protein product [Thlaspi arvense]
MVRFGELCGSSMSLKCKLPTEDLDVLVSISSDEDLANIIDEYDRFSSVTHKELKIRAVLFPLESVKKISPPTSPVSSVDLSATTSPPCRLTKLCSETAASERYWSGGRNTPAVLGFPPAVRKDTAKFPYYGCCYQGSPRVFHRIPLWSLWQ